MSAKDRIIAALDVASRTDAILLASKLSGHVGLFKVGIELFYSKTGGHGLIKAMKASAPDVGIMLDLKLHDIPNTMRGAIRSVRDLGVQFITVHASSTSHLRACVEEAGDSAGILAITVLTSLNKFDLESSGSNSTPAQLVRARAEAAAQAGCAGLVCSGKELPVLREVIDPSVVRVVPGIRPLWFAPGDQKRTTRPAQAIKDGADYLVIGRPIRNSPQGPDKAAIQIAKQIEKAL